MAIKANTKYILGTNDNPRGVVYCNTGEIYGDEIGVTFFSIKHRGEFISDGTVSIDILQRKFDIQGYVETEEHQD